MGTAARLGVEDPRTFRAAVAAMGSIATVAGTRGLLRGAREVPDPGRVTASVDSEYRFYATWYAIQGAALLAAATRTDVDRSVVRATAAGLGLGAAARALSLRSLGRPHPSQVALLAVEAVLAAILVPWHSAVTATPPAAS
ncbi:MAG TPA: DUF4345 family protein [Aquihabitans sp.]|jgi:hypothetical protein|nr:DUF4345 family protein [Aquihabitans sp.]